MATAYIEFDDQIIDPITGLPQLPEGYVFFVSNYSVKIVNLNDQVTQSDTFSYNEDEDEFRKLVEDQSGELLSFEKYDNSRGFWFWKTSDRGTRAKWTSPRVAAAITGSVKNKSILRQMAQQAYDQFVQPDLVGLYPPKSALDKTVKKA